MDLHAAGRDGVHRLLGEAGLVALVAHLHEPLVGEERLDGRLGAVGVADAVENNDAAFGILICGSANGVAITANKHQNIRAAICWGEELAELSRKHNDANIICIPARFVRENLVEKMLEVFMHTEFEGGRHENRVKKISCC